MTEPDDVKQWVDELKAMARADEVADAKLAEATDDEDGEPAPSGKFNALEGWTTDWLGQIVEPGDTVCYFHGGRYDSLNLVLVEKITAEGHVRGELLKSSRSYQDLTHTTIKRNRMVRVDGALDSIDAGASASAVS